MPDEMDFPSSAGESLPYNESSEARKLYIRDRLRDVSTSRDHGWIESLASISQELGAETLPELKGAIERGELDSYDAINLVARIEAPDEDLYYIAKEIVNMPEVYGDTDGSAFSNALDIMIATQNERTGNDLESLRDLGDRLSWQYALESIDYRISNDLNAVTRREYMYIIQAIREKLGLFTD